MMYAEMCMPLGLGVGPGAALTSRHNCSGSHRKFSCVLASSVFSSALQTRVQTPQGPCRHPRRRVSCQYEQRKMRRALQPLNRHHIAAQNCTCCAERCCGSRSGAFSARVRGRSLGPSTGTSSFPPSRCVSPDVLLHLPF